MKLLIHSQTSTVAAVEFWEWISNFIPHFPVNVITHQGAKGATYLIDGLVQDYNNSIANALKLRQSYNKPLNVNMIQQF